MAERLRILCVLPEIPWPTDNGGKQAVFNHMQLLQNTACCHYLALDTSGDGSPHMDHLRSLGFSIEGFPRQAGRFSQGRRGKVKAILNFLFSSLPQVCASRRSPELEARLVSLASSGNFDVVIFEQFSTGHFVRALKGLPLPFVYYSHNVEAKCSWDHHVSCRSPALKLALMLDWLKTRRFEKSLIGAASGVICISDADLYIHSLACPAANLHFIPETLPLPALTWKFTSSLPRLLFVGSAGHPPNREAIEWMVNQLCPALFLVAPDIEVHVAGSSSSGFPGLHIPPNVHFHGRVSNGSLEELYLSSRFAISPVEFGSGVKMKMLEALAFGIPLACSSASLAGLPFQDRLEVAVLVDRASPRKSAEEIANLIHSQKGLAGSMQHPGIMRQERERQEKQYREVLESIVAKQGEPHRIPS